MGRRKVDIEKLNLFILNNINRSDLVKYTSETFNVSRQTIYRTINGLIQNKEIISVGNNRNKSYSLKINKQQFKYKLGNNNTDEYLIWVNDIKPLLTELPENVIDICHYGVTEMVNNVNDHSEASELKIIVEICSLFIGFWIIDDGIGIFTKIKNHFNLLNKNHAILELTKGKLTSDPSRHTGEGIFFTSRMFDHFTILSEDLAFLGHNNDDWLFPDRNQCIYEN
jgi:anti-sigma regulatory factor (Ser/Thr protein kinase)